MKFTAEHCFELSFSPSSAADQNKKKKDQNKISRIHHKYFLVISLKKETLLSCVYL